MSVAQIARGQVPSAARRAAAKDWMFLGALVVFGIVIVAALLGPWLAPYDANQLYVGPINGSPTLAHPFGTDDLGRDILSRTLVGAGASVFAPIVVVVLSTAMGLTVAVTAAWFGGWVSGGIARIIDVIFAIPGLVIAVLAVAMFGKGLIAPVVALSIAYIPVVARLTQTAASRELGKPYVAALRVQGVSSTAICFRHLLPAMMPLVAAQLAIGFGYAMLDLAAISFLGLGQQPPAPDWGSMIANGQAGILAGAPEQSLFPAILVVVTVLAVGIIGARVTVWAEGKDR
ncbi:ABC transporter permease [Microbacterium thalassium]|uniref:Peptide/nickel transport system permease protein n=1 Tax=Microbacterium thalassium TaxID=362649 RepID=A0A7X0FMR3_9MICO|nr:ABC transporter permease [Microbacterium thalassium]MBB6390339.1 peptide/nickel transport system permease protein [Microbacterium thalassium]GLK25448.1 glutathione ABC transporter permease GsiD [Microbacterium thalassium]